jgi:hypothetical protein
MPSYAQERRVRAACAPADRRPGPGAKTIPLVCRLPGPVDVGAVEAAVRAFVQRHPALQYQFGWRGERVVLHRAVEAVDGIRCEAVDRAELPSGPAAADEYVRRRIDEPFDVLSWPLLRAGVVRGDEPIFYLSMDHLTSDGWSAFRAKAEIEALYAAALAGCPADLPPPADFIAYSAAQRRRFADGPLLDDQIAAFQELLAGRPVQPTFAVHPGVWDLGTGRYARIQLLDAGATEAFGRACRGARTTLFMGLLAAYGVAVREATGLPETGIMVATHNRDAPEVRDGIGWYANMLPLYFPIAGTERFGDVVHQVRTRLFGLLDHHELPLARVLDCAGSGFYDGAGERIPTCFMSFVDVRTATRDVAVAHGNAAAGTGWERIEVAPAYRTGYGIWALLRDDGLWAVVASPQVHGGDRPLRDFEDTLVEVLHKLASG